MHAAAHNLYDARPSRNYVKDISSGGPTVPAKWHGLTDKLRRRGKAGAGWRPGKVMKHRKMGCSGMKKQKAKQTTVGMRVDCLFSPFVMKILLSPLSHTR